jgi:hypothetical protein
MIEMSMFLMDVTRRYILEKMKALNAFETLRAFMIFTSGGEGGIRVYLTELIDLFYLNHRYPCLKRIRESETAQGVKNGR